MKKYLGVIVLGVGIILSGLIAVKNNLINQEKPADYHQASFYKQLDNEMVQCQLCPNRCILKPGQRGICGVRENIQGKLYSLVYSQPVSVHVDPIEKKPLYHFLPSSKAYSLGTAGCNLDCKNCQNWDIAHRSPEDVDSRQMTPEEVVEAAKNSGAEVIAFTYNEPTVWYEYMLDIAKLAKKENLKTANISSGYINPEPLKELLPYLDAMKIDLKGFNDKTYQQLNQGRLQPVLDSIKTVHDSDTWLEIVNLVVPGYTDNLDEIKEMCQWIYDEVGPDVPLHFSRFSPAYKLPNLSPTSSETLIKARQTCLDVGLNYVYIGNLQTENAGNTFCPENNEIIIKRNAFLIEENNINSDGSSPNCSVSIPGVWQ
jgi:pyruvate formate lyase activating enzyme